MILEILWDSTTIVLTGKSITLNDLLKYELPLQDTQKSKLNLKKKEGNRGNKRRNYVK